MPRITTISLLIIALLLSAGCSQVADNGSTEKQAWQLIDQGALLLDVRTPEEYQQGHLYNALLIPHDQLANRISELGGDKSRAIVLYCRSGGRAGKAEAVLREHGFTDVLNAGGYQDMMEAKRN
ncbi:MAG: rhodanese-like domain-containing protein [Gammaproteobacteria bacterium]|nr:rhodanese-like domain-containing protein [Gammaproteobacteria bacterium]MCF6229240.1 rhodanese-like domain-containing protein [Gammaproteobacteria bacterium]